MMKTVFSSRIFYCILVIIWIILVFAFSNQNGDKSQGMSDIITDRIVKVVTKLNPDIKYKSAKDTTNFIVRKIAHFTIYFIGGILIFNFIDTFSIKTKNKLLISILIVILYAVSDELHQLFISERTAQIRDVLIDSTGAIIAIFLISRIKGEKWKS